MSRSCMKRSNGVVTGEALPGTPDLETSLFEVNWLSAADPARVPTRSLTLDLTHRCPFRCPGCIEDNAMSWSDRTDLRESTACTLISEFAERGGREVRLYGGEPTAHPQFPCVVQHAARCVPSVKVVTNGAFLVKPGIAEVLNAAAQSAMELSVRVSLNAGTAATHQTIHRTPRMFSRVVEGMALLSTRTGRVRLGVSYLVEEANASEVVRAYDIAVEVGATAFALRAKTGVHSIGLAALSPTARKAVLEAIGRLRGERSATGTTLYVEPWYVRFLETNRAPETRKDYETCYFCAAARVVITPPDPGVVWSCPYWRTHPLFHVANLTEARYGSAEFERRRIEAVRRVYPPRDCANVICDRDEANRRFWQGAPLSLSHAANPEPIEGVTITATSMAEAKKGGETV